MDQRQLSNKFLIKNIKQKGIYTAFHWRPGDLVYFRKVSNINVQSVKTPVGKSNFDNEGVWDAILIGRYKIKIRRFSDEINEIPELLSIEPNNVLPTVSRRYTGREKIDLWLWDNRVFALKNREAFWVALHTLAKKEMVRDIHTKQEFVDIAHNLLKKIIR